MPRLWLNQMKRHNRCSRAARKVYAPFLEHATCTQPPISGLDASIQVQSITAVEITGSMAPTVWHENMSTDPSGLLGLGYGNHTPKTLFSEVFIFILNPQLEKFPIGHVMAGQAVQWRWKAMSSVLSCRPFPLVSHLCHANNKNRVSRSLEGGYSPWIL